MASLRWITCLLMRSRGTLRSLHSKKRPGTQVNQAQTTGSLSNDDDDANENVNNAILVKHASKKTLYISLLSPHDFDAKTSLFHVLWATWDNEFLSHLPKFDTVFKNSTPEILANTDELNEMEWALVLSSAYSLFKSRFPFFCHRSYYLSSLIRRQGRRRAQISDQNRTDQWQRSKFSTGMWAQSFPFLLFKSACGR